MNRRDGRQTAGELRTLLTNVIGFSELMADASIELPPATRAEYAEIVCASGIAIRDLFRKLGETRTH